MVSHCSGVCVCSEVELGRVCEMRHPDPSVQIWRVETAGDGGNELLQRFLPCIITSNLKCLLLIQPPARQTLPATFIRVSCKSGLSFNPLLLIFCKSCLMHASTQGFLHQELDLNWGHLNKQKTSEEIHEKWLDLDFFGGVYYLICLKFLYFSVHAGGFSAADTQSTILLHNWNQ